MELSTRLQILSSEKREWRFLINALSTHGRCFHCTESDHPSLNRQSFVTVSLVRHKKMNDLINSINGKISEIIKDSGDNMVFLDHGHCLGDVEGAFTTSTGNGTIQL